MLERLMYAVHSHPYKPVYNPGMEHGNRYARREPGNKLKGGFKCNVSSQNPCSNKPGACAGFSISPTDQG